MNAPTVSLKRRTLKAGSWVLIGHFLSQSMRFGGNLILTRLLVPEMFGVMGIVNVIIVGIGLFSDIGLQQNIVQSKRADSQSYLNTAWTIQIIRGLLIFIVSLFISAILYLLGSINYLTHETVYGSDELPLILAVMSSTALIGGFNSIQLPLLNRKLMMGKLVTLDIFCQIIGLSITVSWAWKEHDIWALVYGAIISSTIKMLLSHVVIKGKSCRFGWDRDAVDEILNFGKWIFMSSILGFLLNQGDRLLLGGLISAKVLGVYSVAFFLATAVKEILMKLIGSVFYPVLSEVNRNNSAEFANVYYRIRRKIDSLCMLTFGFLFSTGEEIINILYDERYVEAGWMLQILSVLLISVGYMLATQCFLVIGKPKLEMVQVAVQLMSLCTLLPLGFYCYGIKGAVWGIAASSLMRVICTVYLMRKYLFISVPSELFGYLFMPLGWVAGEIVKEALILYR